MKKVILKRKGKYTKKEKRIRYIFKRKRKEINREKETDQHFLTRNTVQTEYAINNQIFNPYLSLILVAPK